MIPKRTIRTAKECDAHTIAVIHVASWQKIYRGHIPDAILDNLSIHEKEEKWLALIKNNIRILIIELDSLMVGFASIGPSRDTDTDHTKCGEISAIYFHPDYWRQGLGRKLCNRAFSELEEMGLSEATVWVLKENAPARKFYEKMGFKETSDIKADKYDNDVILNEIRYRKKLGNPFSFKPLQESDLNLLCRWFDQPHVKQWWDDKLTHDQIKNKYSERIGNADIVPFIAYLEDKPIGFIQYYHANKVGKGWWPNEVEGTVSIDQFIGEKDFLSRGYGKQMICAFGHKLFQDPAIKKIILDVDPNNHRAIHCYENAGLRMMGSINTPDGVAYIMAAYKNQSIEPHHYLLKKPQPDSLLYKIIPSDYFINMLEDNYIYFRRVDTYHDDIRDSDQPDEDKHLSEKSKFENATNYSGKDYYNDCRARTYACCFSTENTPHLWGHYSGSNNSATCLAFNSSRLIDFLNTRINETLLKNVGAPLSHLFYINYGLVTYGDLNSQCMGELLPTPIQYVYFKDANKYSEEKEFRISLSCHIPMGKIKLTDGSFFNFPESLQISFDFIQAINLHVIEKISFSGKHEEKLKTQISDYLKNKISNIELNRLLA